MDFSIRDARDLLDDYRKIPMLKVVNSIYELREIDRGLGGIQFKEMQVDEIVLDMSWDADPMDWLRTFNTENWGFYIIYAEDIPVAGATIAFNTPEVHMLANRKDLAVLWDLRVAPDYQQMGLGAMLFQLAVSWAMERNCTQLKIETQNNNVRACKFYASQGCVLGELNKFAYYGEEDDEVMLIWYKDLKHNRVP